jgi:hypothetical protein
LATPSENDAYLHVFDLARGAAIHEAAIDLEGVAYWLDAQVCGDTVYLLGMSKHDSGYRLYSAPLATPTERTELFRAYGIGNMACEAGS